MTTPEEPWMEPTAQFPLTVPGVEGADDADAARPGRRRVAVVVIPIVALLLVCCGGAVLVRDVFGGGSGKSASGQPTQPIMVNPPSSAPTTDPTTAEPSPSPTKPSPSVAKTTKVATKKPTTKPPATTAPTKTATPTPSATTTAVLQQGVRQGAFCSPEGAFGTTARGRLLRCGPSIDDPRDRWRPIAG